MNNFRRHPLAAALAWSPFFALAQGIATEALLTPVNITETRSQLDLNLPSTTVRKRYFGDRYANLGGRSFGVLDPGPALVYLDGYLISSFMGRFDAPRWNMVNNENIERVDVLYGPFSAIYPGNSVGTTAVSTERKPKGFEASASIKYNQQSFKEYGTSDSYGGTMSSAHLASKLNSGLRYVLGLQHQDVTGQPMGFANVVRGAPGQFAAPAGTTVSGIFYDKDRAIFGASSIDHTLQDTLNLRLGYALSATQELEGRVSWWRNITPYVVLLGRDGAAQRAIGPPSAAHLSAWLS